MSALTRILLVIVGVIMLGLCYWNYQKSVSLLDNQVITTGVVYDYRKSMSGIINGSGRRVDTFFPLIEYYVNGHRLTFQHQIARHEPDYKIGDSIEIVYDKIRPTSAAVNKPYFIWGGVLAFFIIGVMFIGFALLYTRQRAENLFGWFRNKRSR